MNKKLSGLLIIILISLGLLAIFENSYNINGSLTQVFETDSEDDMKGEAESEPYSLTIEALRQGDYPGSDFVVEQTLTPGSNYTRQIVSYKSEGLKIYALLTVPIGEAPSGGWPAVVFNHGYIPPTEYRTTERYIAYTDAFSRNGYILLRPDYRGHGESEGTATGGYGSNNYTIDVLNALASLKKYPGVNIQKIGMWGHSMGGFITLRSMVVSKDIKAGVIWAGVVGSYEDLFERWRRRAPSGVLSQSGTPLPSGILSTRGGSWRQTLTERFGSPSENPEFWGSLSANTFLSDISGPVQLHHGTADTSVPVEFSQILEKQMKEVGKAVEYYEYSGDDHNISSSFGIAAQRSVEFFDKYLK